jgi:Tfp pilus assembly protein PilF|tara:strand:+ start:902 stop:2482 length:1581 start_codon:yes stop_codon:yes gene_type:complete
VIEVYQKAIKVQPNYAKAYNNLGNVFKEIGEQKKAKNFYEKAINIQPNYANTHYNLGLILRELGENKKAITSYQKAIEINPDHTSSYNNLGNLFKELGEYKRAINCYQKSIQIKPDYADTHYNFGLVFQAFGEFQKAVASYQKAIDINPDHTSAYNNLGIVLRELGEDQKAINSYQKALHLDPSSINSQANISTIYISQLDNLEKAINASCKTLKIHFKTNKFINQKISLYRLKHDVQQAEYLSLKGYKINGIEKFKKIGNKILNREENGEDNNNFNQKILLNPNEINSLLPFYNANHIYYTSKISVGCINPNKNWQKVEEQYFNSSKQIMYIDNFLSDEAIKELREFCLVSKVWNKEYKDKYLGAFSDRGFISPLHLQIAIELKQKLPKLFGPHKLESYWAFKYDSTLGKGINIHADFALINLNFWITPDEYNNNKNSGGLKVYDVPAPEDWTFQRYNKDKHVIDKFLNDTKANCTNIPYKFNRAVLFNSAYFHETDEINFKDGYEARRINTTYLFGHRLVKKMK